MTEPRQFQQWASLPAMFFDQAERCAQQPLLWAKRAGAYRPQSWGQVAEAVRQVAQGLRAISVRPGDRVMILSENRPEWLIADFAIMAAGAITVPAYTTSQAGDLEHVARDSGAVAAFVSTPSLFRRLYGVAVDSPMLGTLIPLSAIEGSDHLQVISWNELVARGAGDRALAEDVAASTARAGRDDVACLIYTSGTGGAPKGVMLTHGNILANCLGAFHVLLDVRLEREVFLSFLPLSHAMSTPAARCSR